MSGEALEEIRRREARSLSHALPYERPGSRTITFGCAVAFAGTVAIFGLIGLVYVVVSIARACLWLAGG
jgi:hypothetical protein